MRSVFTNVIGCKSKYNYIAGFGTCNICPTKSYQIAGKHAVPDDWRDITPSKPPPVGSSLLNYV